ncbi:MAG: peptidoglycan editing factor PgeF [Clostridiales bacterium]|nr:peptidoglycan editing factor PgeF [Clostridiales bacterium]
MEIKWKDGVPRMNVRENAGVTFLTYPAFEEIPGILHGFTTRLGGVSQGIFGTMNLSFTRGDEENAVRENYRRIGRALGFSPEDLVTSDQTHTTNVRVVTEADRGCGITKPRLYTDVDGMVTDVPGLVLATFYADCVPLYFVDPDHRAIGLSHSGWRGTAGRMGERTVKKMRETYGSRPDRLLAAVGPSICQDCYEVSQDVIGEFERAFKREYWDRLFYKKANGKYQLDLWEANRRILLEAGIPETRISMPGICTCCNPDFLFSHRATGGKRGNLGAFLGLRP